MKRLLLVAAVIGALALAVVTPSRANTELAAEDDAVITAGPDGLVSAEFDAFAVRIEYDIPLPAGSGSIPRVVGEVRRSIAGENAKGLSAAPSQLDAVIGGTYADPDKGSKGDERRPPQVECFYPGDLLNTRFDYPTDSQTETEAAPAAAFAIARCGAGPDVGLEARNGATDYPGVRVGASVADGGARPASGVLSSVASARASDIKMAEGLITIGSVDVNGRSTTNGEPGGAATDAQVAVNDVTVAGTRFSLSNGRVVLGDQTQPLDAASTTALMTTLNSSLAATGCRMDVLSRPEVYPQGFVLGRKPPALGVAEDGSLAASMQGGLLVLCDLPQTLTAPTGFSPQRMQVLFGFAYTAVAATEEAGGFGIGGLLGATFGAEDGASFTEGSDGAAIDQPTGVALDAGPSIGAADVVGVTPVPELGPAPTSDDTAAPSAGTSTPRARILPVSFAMDPTQRAVLAVLCLSIWALLTHLGLRRLRGVTEG